MEQLVDVDNPREPFSRLRGARWEIGILSLAHVAQIEGMGGVLAFMPDPGNFPHGTLFDLPATVTDGSRVTLIPRSAPRGTRKMSGPHATRDSAELMRLWNARHRFERPSP